MGTHTGGGVVTLKKKEGRTSHCTLHLLHRDVMAGAAAILKSGRKLVWGQGPHIQDGKVKKGKNLGLW